MTDNCIICSGPPGSGKTSVLNHLKSGFLVVPEPARRVLSSQRASGGRGTGDQDPSLFVQLMLKTALSDAESARESHSLILFDRGLPDLLAYAGYYSLDSSELLRAVETFRYAPNVFWFPAWEEIYATDAERTMSFHAAREFGERIRSEYRARGYNLIEVPCASIFERATFIREQLVS